MSERSDVVVAVICVFVLAAVPSIFIPDGYATFGDWKAIFEGWKDQEKRLQLVGTIAAILTSSATMIFVILLRVQIKNQKREHDLTLRPIMVKDRDQPAGAIRLVLDKKREHISVRLVNVGNVYASKARITVLPLDEYGPFMARQKALREYLKGLGGGKLRGTDSCVLMRPIRERMKLAPESSSFENYLILGDDLARLGPLIGEFDAVLRRMGPVQDRLRFDEAGRARAESLAKLGPEEWDKFYLAGQKRGDLLDRIGPIDWEVFDGTVGERRMREMLGEFADEVYGTAPDRARIIARMKERDRERYNRAVSDRLGVWRPTDEFIADYARTSMQLRRAYKEVRDIRAVAHNMIAPKHPIEVRIGLGQGDLRRIRSNEFLYFGVLAQYAKPGGKAMEYAYYMQGRIDGGVVDLDYATDAL